MATANEKLVYSWGLDPIHWTHVKLFIRDLLGLQSNAIIAGAYKLYGHVILRACIMGYVVSVDEKAKMLLFSVDDGTGVIMCCRWKKVMEDEEDSIGIELGMLVKVHGKIKEFDDKRQLTVEFLRIERNPNAEMLHWMDVISLDEVYRN